MAAGLVISYLLSLYLSLKILTASKVLVSSLGGKGLILGFYGQLPDNFKVTIH